jgi:hypothetical protein
MPFGMGPAGWFMWPYFVQWAYGYPYSIPYAPPYSYIPMTKEAEITYLQDQAKALKQEYDRIKARLKKLQEAK